MFLAIAAAVSFLATTAYTCGPDGWAGTIWAKMLASSVFLDTAAVDLHSDSHRGATGALLCAGLLFGWIGDLFLALSKRNGFPWFYGGMAAFLVNQIFFLIALYRLDGFRWREAAMGASLAAAIALLAQFCHVDPGAMRIPAGIYGAFFCFLLAKAISVRTMCSSLSQGSVVSLTSAILLALGIALWAVSDVVLGASMFSDCQRLPQRLFGFSRDKYLHMANAFPYFVGQTITACGIHYLSRF